MELLVVILLVVAVPTAAVGLWAGRPVTVPLSGALLTTAGALGMTDPTPTTDGEIARALVLLACMLLAVLGGGPLTRLVFGLVDRNEPPATRIDTPASSGPSSAPASGQSPSERVLRGGAWIGALERGAVFATLVAGWPEGVAVTLALKGLGRYPELRTKTSGAAERFIIGTFASVLWAAACAGAAWSVTT